VQASDGRLESLANDHQWKVDDDQKHYQFMRHRPEEGSIAIRLIVIKGFERYTRYARCRRRTIAVGVFNRVLRRDRGVEHDLISVGAHAKTGEDITPCLSDVSQHIRANPGAAKMVAGDWNLRLIERMEVEGAMPTHRFTHASQAQLEDNWLAFMTWLQARRFAIKMPSHMLVAGQLQRINDTRTIFSRAPVGDQISQCSARLVCRQHTRDIGSGLGGCTC
jgi:hypothetical protein